MAKDEIKLSKKHGLNPSMDTCFFCGESTGIVLMGELKDDAEAPKKVCTSMDPCEACKKKYNGYLLVVEVKEDKSAPTGRWLAINKNGVEEEFKNYDAVPSVESQFTQILNLVNVKEADNNEINP